MSTLYIRLPRKANADLAQRWQDGVCSFALASDNDTVERGSVASLAELSATIAKAQRIIVILAASDVTLLQVFLPPLSAAKLKAALPTLVEDQLLGNPAECVVVAGGVTNGLRTVAVVERAWLERVNTALIGLGTRHASVLPAQLCLPHQAGRVTAVIRQQQSDIELTLRLSESSGIGLVLSANQPDAVIETLCAIVPEATITLHVSQADVFAYQAALDNAGMGERIHVAAETWSLWIGGASQGKLNLLAGLQSDPGSKIDWRPWRWSLILAAALLIINIAVLNFDWWQMKNEAKNLRTSMTQIYQARFPQETVVVDPIAQMQQKIAFAKRDAGLATPDDFTALAAAFGAAWDSVASGEKPAIASLEYRENSLIVGFKTSQNNSGEALVPQVKDALESHHFSLHLMPADSGVASWKIKSVP